MTRVVMSRLALPTAIVAVVASFAMMAFAGRLRDEVELESVGQALAASVGEAVRPASVGIWLRARGDS